MSQVNHWMEIAGAAMDVLLLLRVLFLKLHRPYVFITLFCLLEVFFDGIEFWLHPDSHEFERVFIYSRFLYPLVYPAAVWDVFEEAKAVLTKLRRLAISRTVSSLVLMTLLGLLMASFAASSDNADSSAFVSTLAVIVWTGSITASLAFLWIMHRTLRTQKLETPHNTRVWMLFFEMWLISEAVSCFFLLLAQFKPGVGEIVEAVLLLYQIGITAWCIGKLRAVPSDVPSAPVSADL
jgi:hypothetical protein